MKPMLRVSLLVLALASFLVFLSFNVQNVGPLRTVTVGLNLSPWLKWSRVKGIEKFTERWDVNVLSWSALGLPAGIALLILRSRVK